MAHPNCILCGKDIAQGQEVSSYRVEGDIKGFRRRLDLQKSFHNECLVLEDGINEVARAQVLDYLEAVQFNKSVVENLHTENLQRAQKIIKEIKWREKYSDK